MATLRYVGMFLLKILLQGRRKEGELSRLGLLLVGTV